MRGRWSVIIVFILGACSILGGFFLDMLSESQAENTKIIFTNTGVFFVLIGLNIMIAVLVIDYYSRKAQIDD